VNYLVHFDIGSFPANQRADTAEQVGQVAFAPLCWGWGKAVEVYSSHQQLLFRDVLISQKVRIISRILTICLLPLTLVFATIGWIACVYSKTYQERFSLFQAKKHIVPFEQASLNLVKLDPAQKKRIICEQIASLRLNHGLARAFSVWFQAEGKSAINLEEAFFQSLQNGSCFGQTMNVFELMLSGLPEMTPELVYQNLNPEKYIRYQIIHILHVFFQNENPDSMIGGVNVQPIVDKLNSLLPTYKRQTILSERIKLSNFTEEDLKMRISDYLRENINSSQVSEQQDSLIKVSLRSRADGHALLLYYSERTKTYYLCDNPGTSAGLFATNDRSQFLNGMTRKILEHRDSRWKFQFLQFAAFPTPKKTVKSDG
jgi:hypothetical protein